MITLNGTPLNDLVKQIICFEHIVNDVQKGTSSYLNTRVQLLLDKEKLSQAIRSALPEGIHPKEMAQYAFEQLSRFTPPHYSSVNSIDLRQHFHTANEGKTDFLFPDALRDDNTLSILFTSSISVLDALKALNVKHEDTSCWQKQEDKDDKAARIYTMTFLGPVNIPDYALEEREPLEIIEPQTLVHHEQPAGNFIARYPYETTINPNENTISFNFGDSISGSVNSFDAIFRRLITEMYGEAPHHLTAGNDHYQLETSKRSKDDPYDVLVVNLQCTDAVLFDRVIKGFGLQPEYQKALEQKTQPIHDPAGDSFEPQF